MGEDDQWGDVTAEPRGMDYAEVSADGVSAMWLVPHGADLDRAIVALHGGGFVGGSLYTHRKMYGHLAKAAGVRVLLATYRLAPEFRYPAQIEDAVTAFRWAAARTAAVALAGDSSGGGLAVQVALREPGAAALLLLSPWIDMDPAQTATSYEENAGTDLFFTRPMVQGLIQQYLPEGTSGLAPDVNAFYADTTAVTSPGSTPRARNGSRIRPRSRTIPGRSPPAGPRHGRIRQCRPRCRRQTRCAAGRRSRATRADGCPPMRRGDRRREPVDGPMGQDSCQSSHGGRGRRGVTRAPPRRPRRTRRSGRRRAGSRAG
jgi:monoterpene epsilon-lactone hydrolase